MNIFITYTDQEINPVHDARYYFVNTEQTIVISLLTPIQNMMIRCYRLFKNDNFPIIMTNKGHFILDNDIDELVIYYLDNNWVTNKIHNKVPFVSFDTVDRIEVNYFEKGFMGRKFISTHDRGSTSKDNRYKMSNLFLVNCYNFRSVNDLGGTGSLIVFRKTAGGNYVYESKKMIEFDRSKGVNQGWFSKDMVLINMGLFDVLLVLAPLKETNQGLGLMYLYTYQPNNDKITELYLFEEQTIPYPDKKTIKQIQPIDLVGFSVLTTDGYLYIYKFNTTTFTTSLVTSYPKSYNYHHVDASGSFIYFANQSGIKRQSYNTSGLTGSESAFLIQNTNQLLDYGKIMWKHPDGLFVMSHQDFHNYNNSFVLQKRIDFKNVIDAFDYYNVNGIKKYLFIADGSMNNLYIMDQSYNILMNDLMKENTYDWVTQATFDASAQSFFLGIPNSDYMKDKEIIVKSGNVINYDLFFDHTSRNIFSLFPSFDINNELFVEEKTFDGTRKYFKEQAFDSTIQLISNRTYTDNMIFNMHQVHKDLGIIFSVDYNGPSSHYLNRYSRYFIYCNPYQNYTDFIFNQSSLFLGWLDNQMLVYNTSQSEIYFYKDASSNKIKCNLIGIGNQVSSPSGKVWNIISSDMVSDISKNSYDISLNLFGNIDPSNFVKFEQYTHNEDLVYLIREKFKITIVDFFKNQIYTKTYARNIKDDMFYVDTYKNLFQLYKDPSNNFLISIYVNNDYQSYFIENLKTDLTTLPAQIGAQYFNQQFILLESYETEVTNIKIRKFDIVQGNVQTLSVDPLNVSNTYDTKKTIIHINYEQLNIDKLVISNKQDLNNRIYQKLARKIYSLPTIGTYNFLKYTKNIGKQLHVSPRNILNYDQYKINDLVPDAFFNKKYQKYFGGKNLGIYSYYFFYDIKDEVSQQSTFVQVNKQKTNSFLKFFFYPSSGNIIVNHLYDQNNHSIIIVEKAKDNSSSIVKVYDVTDEDYIIQADGTLSGQLLASQTMSGLICYDTLSIIDDVHDGFFISEEFDPSQNRISFWTFSSSNNYTPTKTNIPIVLPNGSSDVCFYRSYDGSQYLMDEIFNQNQLSYFESSGNTFIRKYINLPSHITIAMPFDIEFLSTEFFILKDHDFVQHLFVQNKTLQTWYYYGKMLDEIKNAETFEISRSYFVDFDIISDHSKTNGFISANIFYNENGDTYTLQNGVVFKLDKIVHPYLKLSDITTVDSDSKTLFTKDQYNIERKLLHLPNKDLSNNQQIVTTDYYFPKIYRDDFSKYSTYGNFQSIDANQAFSKNYLFDNSGNPSVSYNSINFPIVDVSKNIIFSETKKIYRYKPLGNTTVMDSSSTNLNFSIQITSDEQVVTDGMFNTLNYLEINYTNQQTVFDQFLKSNHPAKLASSPDASKFMNIQAYGVELFNNNRPKNDKEKYDFDRFMVPDNALLRYVSDDDLISDFEVDWYKNQILMGFGSLGPTGSNKGFVAISIWNEATNKIALHSIIQGNNSFGYTVNFSKDSNYLVISEPKAYTNFHRGKIHIYKFDESSKQYTLVNTLISKNAPIGKVVDMSFSNNKLATMGHSDVLGSDTIKLVIFDNVLSSDYTEVLFDFKVYDFAYIGNTEQLLVSISSEFSYNHIQKSTYLIEAVNGNPYVYTKLELYDSVFNNDPTNYMIQPINNNFVIFYSNDKFHLVRIYADKSLDIVTTYNDIVVNSNFAVSEDKSTLIFGFYIDGSQQYMIYH